MTEVGEATIVAGAGLRPRAALPAPVRAVPRASRNGLALSFSRALEERRLFLLLPFAMIAGLIASTAIRVDPNPIALAAIGGVVLGVCVLVWRRLTLLRLAVVFVAFWLGFCLLSIHGALLGTEMLGRPVFGTYTMVVDEVLSESVDGSRLVVTAITPGAEQRPVPFRRARLALDGSTVFSTGDVITGRFRFAPVPGPALPGGFDSQFHSYFDGIGAYASAIGGVTLVTPGQALGAGRVVDGVRRAIGARIDAALVQPAAGIARALITGDQSGVAAEARDVMATAGLAHVLSISGLHLTIVAGGVFAALRMAMALWTGLARRVSTKRVAAVGGILAALLYFSISGGNVAALRATIMILLVLGAVVVGRRALTMRNVGIAAVFVILSDPASVFRPSFQLSFAAVVALIGAWELSSSRGGKERGLPGQAVAYVMGSAATSLIAGAATLLFSAYHFQQTSPLGVLGNLVALPLVGFVMMPAAVLAVVVMPLGIEGPFLLAVGWSIDRMIDVARLVAGLSGGIDASPLLTPTALVIGLVALCWFSFFKDRWRLVGPLLAIPAVVLLAVDRPPDVLVSDTTQAVAVRFEDGMRLISGKPGSFAVSIWGETYGETIGTAGADDPVRCDSVGCIATPGFVLALIDDPAGLAEDCGSSDVVITRRRAPAGCAAPVVIDKGVLATNGVEWLRWDGTRFEIRSAIDDPDRAWRIGR